MPNETRNCLFCKIRDGAVPATIVHRDDRCVVFKDIAPRAPTHVLAIPTEHIATLNELGPAHEADVGHLVVVLQRLAKDLGHAEAGYRIVLNCNADAGQTVFHVHAHLLAGRTMAWPPG